ncbi:hypothetical protein ACFE04_018763 [Oxalis oulophora]
MAFFPPKYSISKVRWRLAPCIGAVEQVTTVEPLDSIKHEKFVMKRPSNLIVPSSTSFCGLGRFVPFENASNNQNDESRRSNGGGGGGEVMDELQDLFSKLNPMAEEFVPNSIVTMTNHNAAVAKKAFSQQ